VFKVALEPVTPDMRRKPKSEFWNTVGSTAFGLAQNLGIPAPKASEIIES